jgi:transcriptional regulator with XRE-family HTH domain
MEHNRTRSAAAFGKALKTLRENAGLTQQQLADRVRVDRTYPSLLERGLRVPTLSIVFRVADALGVSASALIAQSCDEIAGSTEEHGAGTEDAAPARVRVGFQIRRRRQRKLFKRGEFADRIGMRRAHYGAVERGQKDLKLSMLERIAKQLEVPVWQIMRESDV